MPVSRGRGLALFLGEMAIREPDVVELHDARSIRALHYSRRNDLRLSVEQLEDALAGSHGRLQDVVLLAKVLDRPEEALRILHEGGNNADGHCSRAKMVRCGV